MFDFTSNKLSKLPLIFSDNASCKAILDLWKVEPGQRVIVITGILKQWANAHPSLSKNAALRPVTAH